MKNMKATGLKLPAGAEYYEDSAHWQKTGGYQGEKMIDRVLAQAKALKWKPTRDKSGNTPDDSAVWHSKELTDPTGQWVLSYEKMWGNTKEQNSFSITVRRVVKPT